MPTTEYCDNKGAFLSSKSSLQPLFQGALLIALHSGVHSASADTPASPVEKPPLLGAAYPRTGHIEVRNFTRFTWSNGKGRFRSEGNATLQYTPLPAPNSLPSPIDPSSRITANEVEYDSTTGRVVAKIGVLMKTPDGIFRGYKIDYDLNKKEGVMEDTSLETTLFTMKGKKIEAKANGSYILTEGEFTSCDHTRPDYRVRASRLTISPNKYVKAKNVTIFAGQVKLPSLPFYTQSLRGGSSALPINYTYNKAEGPGVRLTLTPLQETSRSFDLDLIFSLNGTPRGFLYYQQDLNKTANKSLPTFNQTNVLTDYNQGILDQLAPPLYQRNTQSRLSDDFAPRTIAYATLQNRQFSFTRLRPGSLLSRLPEFGVRFDNILGHSPRPTAVKEQSPAEATGSKSQEHLARAPFLLDANLSVSSIYEQPLNVSSPRFGLRLQAASQPLLLAKNTTLRFGISQWLSYYTATNTAYSLFSPELNLLYTPTNRVLFGIGYRYATDIGKTPFLYDRRDFRHEGALRFQVGGAWGLGYHLRYDLENRRPYYHEFAVLRNLDCLQLGVVYRTFSNQFGIVINYVPPSASQIRDKQERLQKLVPPLPPVTMPPLEEGE